MGSVYSTAQALAQLRRAHLFVFLCLATLAQEFRSPAHEFFTLAGQLLRLLKQLLKVLFKVFHGSGESTPWADS